MNRNFTTISPSAESLILLKGHTSIPFAQQTAELISFPDKFVPKFDNDDFTFWARVLHFETRYLSINQLIKGLEIKNILELSSGFSFRCLEQTSQKNYHYIDTDLPEIIELKQKILNELKVKHILGTLELLSLNALDENQFREVVSHFPDGEILIINEGLLIYLDKTEKEKLCSIIHKLLRERGGYWITSDIYIKNQVQKTDINVDNKTKEFLEQHKIEENKFDSFDEAKDFFNENGFVIDKESNVDISALSSTKYFLKSLKIESFPKDHKTPKLQTTWRLKVSR